MKYTAHLLISLDIVGIVALIIAGTMTTDNLRLGLIALAIVWSCFLLTGIIKAHNSRFFHAE